MDVNDFMEKHGITDADLDRMAKPFEDGTFEPEPSGKVYSGSQLDAITGNHRSVEASAAHGYACCR